MQRVALYDELTISPADDLSLRLLPGGLGTDVPGGRQNLVIRAATALQEAARTRKGAQIALLKRIPTRAGLGGGSADAAAVLHGLNRLWGLRLSLEELTRIAQGVGADVPYCLHDRPAVVEGLGEQVRPVYLGPPVWLILLAHEKGLNTKDVFEQYDSKPKRQESWRMDNTRRAILRGHFVNLRSCSGNSLRRPAESIMEDIALSIDGLYRSGAQFAQMTGTGSAVYGVFSTETRAKNAHAILAPMYGDQRCILTHTLP